jgi:putative ATPase
LMRGLGYGAGYKYAHEVEGKVAEMQCLPDNLRERIYYEPTREGAEEGMGKRLKEIRRRSRTALKPDSPEK